MRLSYIAIIASSLWIFWAIFRLTIEIFLFYQGIETESTWERMSLSLKDTIKAFVDLLLSFYRLGLACTNLLLPFSIDFIDLIKYCNSTLPIKIKILIVVFSVLILVVYKTICFIYKARHYIKKKLKLIIIMIISIPIIFCIRLLPLSAILILIYITTTFLPILHGVYWLIQYSLVTENNGSTLKEGTYIHSAMNKLCKKQPDKSCKIRTNTAILTRRVPKPGCVMVSKKSISHLNPKKDKFQEESTDLMVYQDDTFLNKSLRKSVVLGSRVLSTVLPKAEKDNSTDKRKKEAEESIAAILSYFSLWPYIRLIYLAIYLHTVQDKRSTWLDIILSKFKNLIMLPTKPPPLMGIYITDIPGSKKIASFIKPVKLVTKILFKPFGVFFIYAPQFSIGMCYWTRNHMVKYRDLNESSESLLDNSLESLPAFGDYFNNKSLYINNHELTDSNNISENFDIDSLYNNFNNVSKHNELLEQFRTKDKNIVGINNLFKYSKKYTDTISISDKSFIQNSGKPGPDKLNSLYDFQTTPEIICTENGCRGTNLTWNPFIKLSSIIKVIIEVWQSKALGYCELLEYGILLMYNMSRDSICRTISAVWLTLLIFMIKYNFAFQIFKTSKVILSGLKVSFERIAYLYFLDFKTATSSSFSEKIKPFIFKCFWFGKNYLPILSLLLALIALAMIKILYSLQVYLILALLFSTSTDSAYIASVKNTKKYELRLIFWLCAGIWDLVTSGIPYISIATPFVLLFTQTFSSTLLQCLKYTLLYFS